MSEVMCRSKIATLFAGQTGLTPEQILLQLQEHLLDTSAPAWLKERPFPRDGVPFTMSHQNEAWALISGFDCLEFLKSHVHPHHFDTYREVKRHLERIRSLSRGAMRLTRPALDTYIENESAILKSKHSEFKSSLTIAVRTVVLISMPKSLWARLTANGGGAGAPPATSPEGEGWRRRGASRSIPRWQILAGTALGATAAVRLGWDVMFWSYQRRLRVREAGPSPSAGPASVSSDAAMAAETRPLRAESDVANDGSRDLEGHIFSPPMVLPVARRSSSTAVPIVLDDAAVLEARSIAELEPETVNPPGQPRARCTAEQGRPGSDQDTTAPPGPRRAEVPMVFSPVREATSFATDPGESYIRPDEAQAPRRNEDPQASRATLLEPAKPRSSALTTKPGFDGGATLSDAVPAYGRIEEGRIEESRIEEEPDTISSALDQETLQALNRPAEDLVPSVSVEFDIDDEDVPPTDDEFPAEIEVKAPLQAAPVPELSEMTMVTTPARALSVGALTILPDVPGCDVQALVAQDAFCETYVASTPDGGQVWVKVMADHSDAQAWPRFNAHVDRLRGVHHPHIVAFRSSGLTNDTGRPFLVTQGVLGETLATHMEGQSSYLGQSERLEVVDQLLDALSYLHQQKPKIVHWGLVPAIVVVQRCRTYGAQVQTMLSDLGLVRTTETTVRDPAFETTPELWPYQAPEQLTGLEGDVRSNLYSVGVIAYELLTGQHPFAAAFTPGLTKDVVIGRLGKISAPAMPNVGAVLHRIVMKAIMKDPDQRYQTAAAFRQDLAEIRQDNLWSRD